MKKISLILGTMTFGEQIFGEDVTKMLQCFIDSGFDKIDTAYVYNEGESEILIGKALKTISRKKVKIAGKINPRITGKLDAEAAYMQTEGSLKRMHIDYLDTLYLHFPDPDTPIESVLEACNNLYQQGKIKEFGLSNFPAWLVTDVYYRCKENNWILPTVYEGLYNPLSRKAETELNMALNNLNIRFCAYNPLAGGILTNKYKSFEDTPIEGRFTYRPNYQGRYWRKSFFDAANAIRDACVEYDITIIEAVYRWLAYHSMLSQERGDAIIIGASRLSQLEENIATVRAGTLPASVQAAFEKAWQISKNDAPEYFRFYGTVG